MESIFELSEGDRAAYLQQMKHLFGCTFISLWSYLPHPTNCLIFMDGVYQEQYINQTIASSSSSSGTSLPRRLFDLYRKSLLSVDDGCVPGYAFKNSIPYLELKELELQKLASTQVQLQFYQEARIKTAIFMGCKVGEIELGISIDSQVNFEAEMRNLFPQDFSRQVLPRELLQATDQNYTNLPPSTSSRLISQSLHISDDTAPIPIIQQPLVPPISTATMYDPFQQALESLNQIRNAQFPTIESEDAAITRAILAVISSSPSPTSSASTSSHQPTQKTSAFKRYNRSVLAPTSQNFTRRFQRQNVLKRVVEFIRSSTLMRGPEEIGSRSTSRQLQHMIKERKRREKLNETFEALRSLLPPGSKKAKASILSSTVEYMSSLKAEVEELTRSNQRLVSQLQQNNEAGNMNDRNQEVISTGGSSSNAADHQHDQRHVDIRITNVAKTTSEAAQILELRVSVRGGESRILNIEIRVLELLKEVKNVSLLSIEASTRMDVGSSVSFTDFVWRLKIEGDEWDETNFLEAVRRVIADLAQCHLD